MTSITIDYKQAKEILEMFGDEPGLVTLIMSDGNKPSHSGKGLYAYYEEMLDEGSFFLGVADEDAKP